MSLTMPQLSDSMTYIVTIVKARETTYESHPLKGDALKAMRVHLEDGAQVSIAKEIDHVHYEQRKAIYALYLAAVRTSECELATTKARAMSATNKAPYRRHYHAVVNGSVVTNLLAKLERAQDDQLRSTTYSAYALTTNTTKRRAELDHAAQRALTASSHGIAHNRMLRVVASQPRILQIKMLASVFEHWPAFDQNGHAILPADPQIAAGDITALTLEQQRQAEYTQQATTPPQPEIDMVEWDKVLVIGKDGTLDVNEIMKKVNMILYDEPKSIGDNRLEKHIERKTASKHDDPLDHQLSDTLALDLSPFVEMGAI